VYGGSLSELGTLWARRAALGKLLRSPFQKNPPSLLRGDYFLEVLRAAFADVFPKDPQTQYRPPRQAPVDLTMTVSMIDGEPVPFVDDYGTSMTQMNLTSSSSFPDASSLSTSRSLRMICSGVCLVRFMGLTSCPCGRRESHMRWTYLRGAGQPRHAEFQAIGTFWPKCGPLPVGVSEAPAEALARGHLRFPGSVRMDAHDRALGW
jgi:hypothetical protein